MQKGLDISQYQHQPNFDTLKNNFDFILIKATEGVGYQDPQFLRSQAEARRVGLALGFYHFARPNLGNTPGAEADWFIQVVGELKAGEVLVLDFEVQFANPVPWCKTFLDVVAAKTGCKPLIYLNKSQIEGFEWKSVIQGDYGLWLAYYDGNPDTVSFRTHWLDVAAKQYTSSGFVEGITGPVDLDSFYGEFRAYGFNKPELPTNPEEISNQLVVDDNTRYDFGADIGTQTLGAIRSIVFDTRKELLNSQTTITELNRQIADLKMQLLNEQAKTTAISYDNLAHDLRAIRSGKSWFYAKYVAYNKLVDNLS